MDNEFTYIVFIKRETEKAILIELGDKDLWLPKSQITIKKLVNNDSNKYGIKVPKWLAEKNGLLDGTATTSTTNTSSSTTFSDLLKTYIRR